MPSWWQSLVNCLAKSTRIPLLTTGSVSDHEERQPLPPVRRPQPLQPNIGQARGRPVAQGFGKCGMITRHSASVRSVWYRVTGGDAAIEWSAYTWRIQGWFEKCAR
jgi:hypothetical protein